jgi:hypothetical protein
VYNANHHYKFQILTYTDLLGAELTSPGYLNNNIRKFNVATYTLKKLVSKVDHISLHGGISETEGKIYHKDT